MDGPTFESATPLPAAIPRWPDAIKGELTIKGKTPPFVARTKHYGYGAWPGSPPTLEFRQVTLVFELGDAQAFRYTLQGIPFHVRETSQHPHPRLILNQGQIALRIHRATVHWGDRDPAFYEEILFEGQDTSDWRYGRDDNKPVTKKQRDRLRRGIAMLPQIFGQGQFTFRGTPAGSPGPRKHSDRKAFRRALGRAIFTVCQDLLNQGVKAGALEDRVTKAAVSEKLGDSRPTLNAYLHSPTDFEEAVAEVAGKLLKHQTSPQCRQRPNCFLHPDVRNETHQVASK